MSSQARELKADVVDINSRRQIKPHLVTANANKEQLLLGQHDSAEISIILEYVTDVLRQKVEGILLEQIRNVMHANTLPGNMPKWLIDSIKNNLREALDPLNAQVEITNTSLRIYPGPSTS